MNIGMWEPRQRRTALSVALIVIALGGGWWWQHSRSVNSTTSTALTESLLTGEPLDPPPASATPALLGVDVIGAVQQPGVYFLPRTARVQDAVHAAGGLAPNANREAINLSAHLVDAEQLRVPRVGETAPAAPDGPAASDVPGKLNINTADAAALATLDGIGPALAQRIVAYRTANGAFATIDDLQNVKGISANLFEQLKDQIRANAQ